MMKNRILALLLLLPAPLVAQITTNGTLYSVSGTTQGNASPAPLSASGTCTVTLPANLVTIGADGTTLYANGTPLANLTLPGNLSALTFTVGPAGTYTAGTEYDFIAVTNGNLNLHPMTPGASSTPVATSTTNCAITVPAVGKGLVQTGLCKGVTFKATAQIVGFSPVLSGAPSTDMTLGHTFGQPAFFNGSLWISVWNYGGQTNPQQVWNVSVAQ